MFTKIKNFITSQQRKNSFIENEYTTITYKNGYQSNIVIDLKKRNQMMESKKLLTRKIPIVVIK